MEHSPSLKSIRVADYMSRRLVTLSPGMSVHAAIRLLLEHSISGAPVVEGGALVGLFSESDCLRGAVQSSYHGTEIGSVEEFMTKTVQTIDADDSIFTAADIFLNQRRRRLPVISDGKLVGQISRRDILRAMDDFARQQGE